MIGKEEANRENFQRLLTDVMSGKINCVIVKDLSRFARNYSDAGSLIDNLFVQMGVRFISLAENVDSYLNPDSVSNIIVPITNVMNDNYCYQTSKKIRQVFDYKRRNGQYIGSFAPYGYIFSTCLVITAFVTLLYDFPLLSSLHIATFACSHLRFQN